MNQNSRKRWLRKINSSARSKSRYHNYSASCRLYKVVFWSWSARTGNWATRINRSKRTRLSLFGRSNLNHRPKEAAAIRSLRVVRRSRISSAKMIWEYTTTLCLTQSRLRAQNATLQLSVKWISQSLSSWQEVTLSQSCWPRSRTAIASTSRSYRKFPTCNRTLSRLTTLNPVQWKIWPPKLCMSCSTIPGHQGKPLQANWATKETDELPSLQIAKKARL